MTDREALLREIQDEFRSGARRFTTHALEEATDDDLSVDEVAVAILGVEAEILEDYPKNTRGACCLILGRTASGGLSTVSYRTRRIRW